MFSSPCLSSAAISLPFFLCFHFISINASTHTTLTRILRVSHSTILDICVFEKSSRPNLMSRMSSLKATMMRPRTTSPPACSSSQRRRCSAAGWRARRSARTRDEGKRRETKGDEGRRSGPTCRTPRQKYLI